VLRVRDLSGKRRPSSPTGDLHARLSEASVQAFPAHGGAIAAAIVSEYAVPARSAEPENDVHAMEGDSGETDGGESPIAYIQRRIRDIVGNLREPERPP